MKFTLKNDVFLWHKNQVITKNCQLEKEKQSCGELCDEGEGSDFVILTKFSMVAGISVCPYLVRPRWGSVKPGEYSIGGGFDAV